MRLVGDPDPKVNKKSRLLSFQYYPLGGFVLFYIV